MKRTRTLARPTAAIAAALMTGALLASCSSGGGNDDDAQIKKTTEDIFAALNEGSAAGVLALSCQKVVDGTPEDIQDQPKQDPPIVVDKVENIKVDGDTATADVTASVKGGGQEPRTESLQFVNEDGWKLCE